MSPPRALATALVALLGLVGQACASDPESPPPAAEPAPTEPAPTEPARAPGPGRLDPAQLEALGEPADSPCRAHAVEAGLERGGCGILGPYAGILTGAKGTESDTYAAALDACTAIEDCVGVSTDWYTGSPWYPVRGATSFSVDTNSYGCTLILDCR